MRDPCIIRGADGLFHMVWTVSWNERTIGYASSKDLIHWSEQQAIPVMEHEPTTLNCWAPEIFYDAGDKGLHDLLGYYHSRPLSKRRLRRATISTITACTM